MQAWYQTFPPKKTPTLFLTLPFGDILTNREETQEDGYHTPHFQSYLYPTSSHSLLGLLFSFNGHSNDIVPISFCRPYQPTLCVQLSMTLRGAVDTEVDRTYLCPLTVQRPNT